MSDSPAKPGNKKGHTTTPRKLVPIDKVDKTIVCSAPTACHHCDQPLIPKDKITRHQVFEIPLPRYDILEYQIGHAFCCGCQKTYRGELPKGIGRKGFGVRVHAVISLLTSKFRLSKRQALSLLKDVYDIPISVGTVSNIEGRVSESLAAAHIEVKEKADHSKVVHIDETGFKHQHRSGWAWVVASKDYSFFKLDISHGKKIAKQLIGDFNTRTIVSDRYPVYDYLPERCHQICWSHLKRDFQRISERGGMSGVIGRNLLKYYGRIFSFWKSNREKDFINDRRSLKKRKYLERKLLKELRKGFECEHQQTSRTCRRILDQGDSLFIFLQDKTVPATNNLAEQQLRPLVISKKLSFGVQSDRGARFVERIFSITGTFAQQKRNPLIWLQEAVHHYFCGQAMPSIL